MKLIPLAAFLAFGIAIGTALSYSPPADPNYITPEYGELLEKYRAKVAECDSIDFARLQALEAKGLAESKLAELQAKGPTIIREPADTTELESLRVQLAEAKREAEANAEATIERWTASQKKSNACADGSCGMSGTYQPRRRLFGRFR